MPWRNWSVIIVLILANYVVFSIIGTLLFPVTPAAAPTHVIRPTFTPGVEPLQRVGTLTYDFLTPSPTPTATGASPTPRSTVIPTSTSTTSSTVVPTKTP